HQQSAFRQRAKFDRRKPELLRHCSDLRRCAVIGAREEHDPLATMDGRILGKNRRTQMVETLDYFPPLNARATVLADDWSTSASTGTP
ncbi:MAG: hypothetical protein JWP59_1891, partial [Massilia sp.]|nr:hypothetical protein [Massilia sp.]